MMIRKAYKLYLYIETKLIDVLPPGIYTQRYQLSVNPLIARTARDIVFICYQFECSYAKQVSKSARNLNLASPGHMGNRPVK